MVFTKKGEQRRKAANRLLAKRLMSQKESFNVVYGGCIIAHQFIDGCVVTAMVTA